MSTGRKIFATAQIVNGKIVIDLGDTANYMTVKGSDGIIFIVERNSKEFVEVKDKRYEQQDELNRTIRLSKWNEDKKNGWEIRVDTTPNLYSLRNMEEFDLLLIKLQRADVRLVADELGDEDYVYSDTKPEPTYE